MDITTVNREDLVKDYEEKNAKFKIEHEKVFNHVKSIFDDITCKCGIDTLGDMAFYDNDINRFDFIVKDNKNYYRIDFRFDKWVRRTEDNRYGLSMNFCTFGSFTADKTLEINYLISLGKFSAHLEEIESQLLDYDWETYDSIYLASRSASWKIENYDAEVARQNDDKMKKDLRNKIVVGTKIKIGEKFDWSTHEKVDDIREVVKITPKNINVYGFCHRIKIDECLNYLANGKWSFVA